MPSSRYLLRLPALMLAVTATSAGCGGEDQDPLHPPTEGQLILTFDESVPGGIENTGTAEVVIDVVTANGGEIVGGPSPTTDAGGLDTPAYVDSADSPNGIVRVVDPEIPDELDPGDRDFGFGADINVDPDSESSDPEVGDNGNNVVQRGLFDGVQYKLQIDHETASCRVKGDAGDVTVESRVSIEAERWYRLDCDRAGDEISLSVTDMEAENPAPVTVQETGSTGSLTPEDPSLPLSVGGKLNAEGGIVDTSDQFNGLIDNVYLAIG